MVVDLLARLAQLAGDGGGGPRLPQELEDPDPQRVPEHLQRLDVLDHVHRLRHDGSVSP